MFPAIPLSRNSGVEQRKFHLLSICFTWENVSRNSAVPQFRNSAVEQRKFCLFSISFTRENVSQRELSIFNGKHFPFFRCPVFFILVAPTGDSPRVFLRTDQVRRPSFTIPRFALYGFWESVVRPVSHADAVHVLPFCCRDIDEVFLLLLINSLL